MIHSSLLAKQFSSPAVRECSFRKSHVGLLQRSRRAIIRPKKIRPCYGGRGARGAELAPRVLQRERRKPNLTAYPGSFAWYEVITTDVVSAAAFYHDVVGWGARDASTQNLPYTFFTAGEVPVAGLMELPEEGR